MDEQLAECPKGLRSWVGFSLNAKQDASGSLTVRNALESGGTWELGRGSGLHCLGAQCSESCLGDREKLLRGAKAMTRIVVLRKFEKTKKKLTGTV